MTKDDKSLVKISKPYKRSDRGDWAVFVYRRRTLKSTYQKESTIVCGSEEAASLVIAQKKNEYGIVAPDGAGAAAGGADDGEQVDQHEEAMEVVEEHHAEGGGGGGGGAPGGEPHQGEPEPHQGEPHAEAQREEEPPYHRPALSRHQKYDPSWQYVRSIKVVAKIVGCLFKCL
jgi:hypothetical protein